MMPVVFIIGRLCFLFHFLIKVVKIEAFDHSELINCGIGFLEFEYDPKNIFESSYVSGILS